jgi:UDP-N-acetylglucosamine diphosphorylase/glucosamine-1-phosphate N-acetyltransferase
MKRSGVKIDKTKIAAVILAAGLGKRMKSTRAKVLHELMGKPMILYVVDTAKQVAGQQIILVVGNQADEVRETVLEHTPAVFALQKAQLGTGHAVLSALPHIPPNVEHVIILCGDVPLLTAATLKKVLESHISSNRDLTLLGVEVEHPAGYGRIVLDEQGGVLKIIEEADATDRERKIRLVNTGTYCAKQTFLADTLKKIGKENAQGEFYFTDAIRIGYEDKRSIGAVIGSDPEEVMGVNTQDDLKRMEEGMKKELKEKLDFT